MLDPASDPAIQHLAAMPDDLLKMLEKTDPLRAQIVKDCRDTIEKSVSQPVSQAVGGD
jgi:hypothetical protein